MQNYYLKLFNICKFPHDRKTSLLIHLPALPMCLYERIWGKGNFFRII